MGLHVARPDGRGLAAAAAGGAGAALVAAWAGPWWLVGLGAGAAAGLAALLVRPPPPPPPPAVRAPSPSPAPALAPARGLAELAQFLEALPDPALLIDRDGRIVGSNRAVRRQLQFEAAGLRLSSILRHPGLNEAALAAAQDGATQSVEYETADQPPEHFRVYVAPVAWGEEAAALMVFHDQTTVINTERMRADFLANASHELRTPLASLSLLIETLCGPARADTDSHDRFFTMMQAQADRMRRLIEDLLSLSKIELDEHVPPAERADLGLIVREAADAALPMAQTRAVRIDVATAPGEHVVIGDRFQLAQVAQNLIDNAVKYSPEGGQVRVEVGIAGDRDDAAVQAARRWPEAARMSLLTPPPTRTRPFVYLRVEDQGGGIARRHLPRLGERFYRVERDETAARTGTGLGLAIVKHIANRHRGGLSVESVVGRGTAFAAFFEQADAPAAARAAE